MADEEKKRDEVTPLAVATGENVSNVTSSAVLNALPGELVANVTSSAVLNAIPGEFVSNVTSSAVLIATPGFLPPVWDSTLLFDSPAVTGVAYDQAGQWCQGGSPITYTLNSGTIPPGLALSSSGISGTLSGTPTMLGTYIFTLLATNSFAAVVSQSFTIVVTSAGGGGSWALVG